MYIIFAKLGGISTDKIPAPLFYMTGLTIWNYFAESLTKTSETFIKNQNIFGKVFFPRLIVPLSVIISNLLKFGIQFTLLLVVCGYYLLIYKNEFVHCNIMLLLVPVLVIMMAGLSLGFGILFSSITTKYKDMNFLLLFGVQLLMYASSVVIPISTISLAAPNYEWVFRLNPMVNIIEAFKYAFLGEGGFDWMWLGYSAGFMIALLFFGVIIFNRVEKSFMDTV